jgi:hypothetical protein
MAEEPKKDHPEDIESILSDLDAILTDMGGDAKPAPSAPPPNAPPPKAPPVVEVPVAKAAEPPPPPKPAAPPPPPKAAEPPPPPKAAEPPPPPKAVEPPPPPKAAEPPPPKAVELPPPPPPKPATVPPPVVTPKPPGIELAPREGMITPPKPAPKPAAPAEPPKAAPEPAKPVAPTAVPAPAPVVASTQIEELPADTPKEQIRRVAYVYTAACAEVKAGCAAFLSQAARTISKKPIFLREVLSHEVGAASDPNAVLQKALQVKAAALLAVVDGWPPAKVEELSEACSRANVLFRAVAPADAQKKSTAVDIIVDMMLLPGEG